MRPVIVSLIVFAAACGEEGIAAPSPQQVVRDTVLVTRIVRDTLFVSDTVWAMDTVYLTRLENGDDVRLGGSLAWGGGPPIGSSAHVVAKLPDGRWGIGTDAPEARLHIQDGDFRLSHGRFRLRVTGDFIGDDPAGVGITLDRDANQGPRNMGINFQQAGRNLWGLGLDATTSEPFPDYVAVFESGGGDIFRFRQGGRAALGNGVGKPEPHHVLTVADVANDYIANVLNLTMSESGNAIRYIRTFDGGGIPFAVGEGGRTGIGRDYSSSAMLVVAGDIEARQYLTYSDSRLKENIQPLGDVLDHLLLLDPVSFQWRDDGSAEPDSRIGLIAQEVERVLPGLVAEDESGIKTIDYDGLLVLLLRAVQEMAEDRSARHPGSSRLRSSP